MRLFRRACAARRGGGTEAPRHRLPADLRRRIRRRTTFKGTPAYGAFGKWAKIKERGSIDCHETVLGVDGGQSSTTVLIGDESGRVLGAGEAGPCNHAGAEEGRARFVRRVNEGLRAACAQAGLDAATVCFESACLGMSGGPDDKQAILAACCAPNT